MLSSFMLMITPMFLDKKSSSLILYHWLKAELVPDDGRLYNNHHQED